MTTTSKLLNSTSLDRIPTQIGDSPMKKYWIPQFWSNFFHYNKIWNLEILTNVPWKLCPQRFAPTTWSWLDPLAISPTRTPTQWWEVQLTQKKSVETQQLSLKDSLKTSLKTYGCFLKWWYPQIIHFNRVFHYKPSILGCPYFWKHPYEDWTMKWGMSTSSYMRVLTYMQKNQEKNPTHHKSQDTAWSKWKSLNEENQPRGTVFKMKVRGRCVFRWTS